MQTIHSTIRELHTALAEYIEATYHISAPTLIKQRKELLDCPGVIHQEPYIESTPRYKTGQRFEDMHGLPAAALEVFQLLSQKGTDNELPRLLYNPPYKHQSEAIINTLIKGRNLVVMTGTGSGKTEAFLLPILGKLAREANEAPEAFLSHTGLRALILYPMNALVNDQLGRLRALFGDPRVVRFFKDRAGRPPRFARYTSRTPYAGVRDAQKDSNKLAGFGRFFVDLQKSAENGTGEEQVAAQRFLQQLRDRGKWPAKPDLAEWFGEKGGRWKDKKTDEYVRAVTLPDDSELLTRHEVQVAPPDLLVTNYSMLEYMLIRPVERPIFDSTQAWLAANPKERFLLVLDEAHLYRGAAGAEVGLLLRRLRDRLGIPPERFQIICATASFGDKEYAADFGAQISGVPPETFVPITGDLDLRAHEETGSSRDAEVLSSIDLKCFYAAESEEERLAAIQLLLKYRDVTPEEGVEASLHTALQDFDPMGRLINLTMQKARPISELSGKIFPEVENGQADAAVTVLMALGSIARKEPNTPGLLPCRIHNFFRGLPGLWVCMDPECTELDDDHKDSICGKMYAQPLEFCNCGSRVLEFFTCRNCGTAYVRGYTDNVDNPETLWSDPGHSLRIAGRQTSSLYKLDLLLEQPVDQESVELFDYDLETGRLNPLVSGERMRRIYLSGKRHDPVANVSDEDEDVRIDPDARGQFKPCAVCGKSASYGRSYIQDHKTKGDEPFQTLISRQILIQPPAPTPANDFAPLRGRKALTFSDSRQVAARLAPNLQNYSVRDSLRPLILYGFRRLQKISQLQTVLSLEDLYFAVLLASRELHVPLRPELKKDESFWDDVEQVQGVLSDETAEEEIHTLCIDFRSKTAPEALLENILNAALNPFLGLEALALATIIERHKHASALENLPDIPGAAETKPAKQELARAWLRCWQSKRFWLKAMPPAWSNRPSSEGMSVRSHQGRFKVMKKVLKDKEAHKIFQKQWLPELLNLFTERLDETQRRLRGSELSLLTIGPWVRCSVCKSVHRPVSGISHCLDCGNEDIAALDPDSDPVFLARKGHYRKPAATALTDTPKSPMALIAAEHTAQLNAPQHEDIFSKAEENELLFQDVELTWDSQDRGATAIDVLSSTTTMEVGIDLGSLSGVALRNMPPARANYQQRAGRAGRRGNAIATVVAFGSADTHDEHYFADPDGMICGKVVDPRLTLKNKDIAQRHVLAFLLQNYHQARLQNVDATQPHNLFSVLGEVSDFQSGKGPLNRADFAAWLTENEESLRDRVDAWIPDQLSASDRTELLNGMKQDCLSAINEAVNFMPEVKEEQDDEGNGVEDVPEPGDAYRKSDTEFLLDRLLYCGKLPRYAFPTDVAAFHVFDRGRSTPFWPVMRFSPQQGLAVALTQYAPGKQIWIAGKRYTSGALYSSMRNERRNAWESQRLYLECSRCGFAKTEARDTDKAKDSLRELRDCQACLGEGTFGPARRWIRPPGFAHPIDMDEATSPDEIPETSYATRAKLTMASPMENRSWTRINRRARALSVREHLLVSNSGPRKEGYSYCTECGRIEASTASKKILAGPHQKPFPARDNEKNCEGNFIARKLVLGTDFITDIALFSVSVKSPVELPPGEDTTSIALRTLSEALAQAACQLLEIDPDELMAEYRPALTQPGTEGLEAEIFLYDTLPGGAGFSSQLPAQGEELFRRALKIMKNCPQDCDASCYRCLRSFKNKFEHAFLDRHAGAQLLEYLVTGSLPPFDKRRLNTSTTLLADDIKRSGDGLTVRKDVNIGASGAGAPAASIHISRTDGAEFTVVITGAVERHDESRQVIPINELVIRGNLSYATRQVIGKIQGG